MVFCVDPLWSLLLTITLAIDLGEEEEEAVLSLLKTLRDTVRMDLLSKISMGILSINYNQTLVLICDLFNHF